MQSTSVAPWQPVRFSHIASHRVPSLRQRPRSPHLRNIVLSRQIHVRDDFSQTLELSRHKNSDLNPDKKSALLAGSYFSFDNPDSTNSVQEKVNFESKEKLEARAEEKIGVLPSNMWWTDLKAAIGQRINIEGIISSAAVIVCDQHLALPHVAVRDIRHIDWVALKKSGFKGVVFDKDNTITVPYSLRLWAPLESSMRQCKSVFGNNIAVFSNSAGLLEFDPDGRKAKVLERAIGIKVVRHRVKKPAGTAEEIEKHFGCESSQLIMVGDRPLTDTVYGNRNGFFTILTEPLSLAEEPFIVRQVRKLEVTLVNLWSERGLKPMSHGLLKDSTECIKGPPSS